MRPARSQEKDMKQLREAPSLPPHAARKRYRKPELVVHGDVARLTGGGLEIGKLRGPGRRRSMVGGLYQSS
jgi:hypothetical protein